MASDIILALFQDGGFNWTATEIVNFTKKHIRRVWSETSRRIELDAEDAPKKFVRFSTTTLPNQEPSFEAKEALLAINRLPKVDREVMHILMDGGTIIDVSIELKLEPWDAVRAVKEARQHVERV